MSTLVDQAKAAWGAAIPDWVVRLAEECDLTSQNRVAKRLGVSAAMVSNVRANKYTGTLTRLEDKVRGVYMSGTFECPALGNIPTNECRDWRDKSKVFGAANPLRVRMYAACHACEINSKEGRK